MVELTLAPGYNPRRDRLVNVIKYQVSHYYPKLADILVPTNVFQSLARGLGNAMIGPPKRWEEPIVKYYTSTFQKLMNTEGFLNSNEVLESDLVYASVVNPDIKSSMRNRIMPEDLYRKLEKLIREGHATALPGPSSTALVVHQKQVALAPYELTRRLDNLTNGMLAVESGLHPTTVAKLQKKGFSGSQIVDLGFDLKDAGTTSGTVQKIINRGIEEVSALIDASRLTKCSVVMLLQVMADIGTDDVSDVLGIIEDSLDEVSKYAEEHRMVVGKAWYALFKIYSDEGQGDLSRSLDILTGRFLSGWDEADGNYWEAV